jgi:hypothetical protein
MQGRPGGPPRQPRHLGNDLQLAAGEIHSAGSARYAGNTMEGTVTARVPGANGQPVDAPGHIAGRYLAPCDAK